MTLTLIESLRDARSETGGTSLITMYISANSKLDITTKSLIKELSTSQNIKSKAVKTSVQTALKSCLQICKTYGHTAPENGLVLCAGATMSHL